MGQTESRALTHKDVAQEMAQYYHKLPRNDQNLYNYGITQLVQESKKSALKNVEVCFNFSNGLSVNVKSEDNPKNCFVVCHDGSGGFRADWETETDGRYVYRLLSDSVLEFMSWLKEITVVVAGGVAGAALKAVTYN